VYRIKGYWSTPFYKFSFILKQPTKTVAEDGGTSVQLEFNDIFSTNRLYRAYFTQWYQLFNCS